MTNPTVSTLPLDVALLASGPKEVAARVKTLEEMGVDGVFTFDGPREPFLPLAFAAEHSERLTLGSGIAVAFARTPMTVAQMAHQLQVISKGRFRLGLGSQIKAHIERRFGAKWQSPHKKMGEFLQATRAILHGWQTGEKLSFKGEFYEHTLMPPMFNPGRCPGGPPPLMLAAVGPKKGRVAATYADGLIVHPFHTKAFLEESLIPNLESCKGERAPELGACRLQVQILVGVANSSEKGLTTVREAIRQQIAFYASTPAYRWVLEAEGYGELQPELRQLTKEGRWLELHKAVDDTLLHKVAAIGSPKDVAQILKQRYDGMAERLAVATPMPLDDEAISGLVDALRALEKPAPLPGRDGSR